MMIPVAAVAYAATMAMSIGQPIWFDENYSILLAKSSFSELMALTGVDAHPPLYYLLLKAWGSIFGFSEFALRSLSAVLFGGSIVVALSLIRKAFSTKTALITLPFILLAPFLLRYGYEVRMYALASFIGIFSTYALLQAKATQAKKWWVTYAILLAAGMYTLYLMVAIFLAHAVWLLIDSIRSKQRPFWKWSWWYAFAGAVLLFAPYIPTFLHQLLNSALPGIGSQVTITQLGNIFSTLTIYTPEWAVNGWFTFTLIAFVVVVSVLGARVYKTLKKAQRPTFWLLVALAVIPVIFFALSSLPPRDPIFTVRYMAHVAIFVYLLIGLIVALSWTTIRIKKKPLVLSTILTLGVLSIGTFTLAMTGNFNFERMQHPMTQQVRQAAACDDKTTVVANDPYTYIDSEFYFQDCDLRFFAKDNVNFAGGYAKLHDSVDRISQPGAISTERLVHLRWNGNEGSFTPDARYELVETHTYDKQVVDIYTLSAE